MSKHPSLLEPEQRVVKTVRVGRKPVEIRVLGHRDPRGPDNNVFIWVDEQDQLHISVYKTDRCYRFDRVVETASMIEVVAK